MSRSRRRSSSLPTSSSTRSARRLRGRTYVFTDLAGEELCLRPDLTVPVSRLYLERHPSADRPARYCYNGPAFRFQPKGPSATHPREFRQAGIECFGVADREAADQEIVRARCRRRAQRRAQGLSPALRRYRSLLRSARRAGSAGALAAEASSTISGGRRPSTRCFRGLPAASALTATAPRQSLPPRSIRRTRRAPRNSSPSISKARDCRSPATARLPRSPPG